MDPKGPDDATRRDEDERASDLLRRFREDQARRAAEQAARDAEVRSKREAEEAARKAEENARAEALWRERRAEEARKETEEAQRKQDEEREREEMLQRTLADAQERRKAAEERALREQRAKEDAARLRQEVAGRVRAPAGRTASNGRGRRTVTVVFLLAVICVVVLHFVAFDGSSFERAAAARLGVPVKIGATRFSTLPLPALHFERVTIGPAAEVKIDKVTVKAGLRTILDAKKHFSQIEIDGAQVPVTWFIAALWEKAPGDTLHIERLIARNLKILVPGAEFPAFNGEASFDAAGMLKSMQAETADRSRTFGIDMQSGKAEVTYSSKPFSLPFPGFPQLSDFTGIGTLTPLELVVTKFDANVLGGSFVGSARLRWSVGWSLDGEFVALSMDPAKVAPKLVPSGRLEGRGTFSMRAPSAEKLAESARLDSTFSVHRGALGFVNLTRALQSPYARGGTTPFNRMDGTATVTHSGVLVRQIRLSAGLLNAAGDAVVDAQGNLDGRLRVDMPQAAGVVSIGGTVAAPQVK